MTFGRGEDVPATSSPWMQGRSVAELIIHKKYKKVSSLQIFGVFLREISKTRLSFFLGGGHFPILDLCVAPGTFGTLAPPSLCVFDTLLYAKLS